MVVKSPIGGGVGAETLAGVARVTARPRPDVEDADFEDVSGLGAFHRDRPGQEMHAQSLAGSTQVALGRPGSAPCDRLVLARPGEDAFRTGIAGYHPLPIVAGVMRQSFDGGAVPGAECQGGRDDLAEIAPMDRRRRYGEVVFRHASYPAPNVASSRSTSRRKRCVRACAGASITCAAGPC